MILFHTMTDIFTYICMYVCKVPSKLNFLTDEIFLKKYVAESTANPELVAVIDADAGNKKAML